MAKRLPCGYFQRPVREVAPDLLGAYLAVRTVNGIERQLITEVEAYDGPEDKACHAARGRTARTEVLFWRGGVLYVYLIYGMYAMLNVVAGSRDYPAGVLIRATDSISGPGRLTRDLKIDTSRHGMTPTFKNGVWFERSGITVSGQHIYTGPRIGVEYAGEWANAPLRYMWLPPSDNGDMHKKTAPSQSRS